MSCLTGPLRGHFVTLKCFAWTFRWSAQDSVPTNGRNALSPRQHEVPGRQDSALGRGRLLQDSRQCLQALRIGRGPG
jgi:hypothetical protein